MSIYKILKSFREPLIIILIFVFIDMCNINNFIYKYTHDIYIHSIFKAIVFVIVFYLIKYI